MSRCRAAEGTRLTGKRRFRFRPRFPTAAVKRPLHRQWLTEGPSPEGGTRPCDRSASRPTHRAGGRGEPVRPTRAQRRQLPARVGRCRARAGEASSRWGGRAAPSMATPAACCGRCRRSRCCSSARTWTRGPWAAWARPAAASGTSPPGTRSGGASPAPASTPASARWATT